MIPLIALVVLSSQGQKSAPAAEHNVWFCPYIEVTSHSPFDQTPAGSYDARDAFGGSYGSVKGEVGHVVFEDDDEALGKEDFIEWHTKEAVEISRLIFSWQDDAPGNSWRNLARFAILGRRNAAGEWTLLWAENTPMNVGRFTLEKKITPDQYQYFRAEFLRSGTTNGTATAPRICQLEAYGRVVVPFSVHTK